MNTVHRSRRHEHGTPLPAATAALAGIVTVAAVVVVRREIARVLDALFT